MSALIPHQLFWPHGSSPASELVNPITLRSSIHNAEDWHETPVAISVHTLLQAFPDNSEWIPAAGPFTQLLSDMLDAGTSLFEEKFDFEMGIWSVRLTSKGRTARAG